MKQRNLAWTYGPRPRIVQLNLRQKFLKWLKETRDNKLCKLCALWHLWHKIISDLCAYSVESIIYTTICFASLQGGSTEWISKHCNLCYIKYDDFKTPQMYRAVCYLYVFSVCFLCTFCDSFTSIHIFVYTYTVYVPTFFIMSLTTWTFGILECPDGSIARGAGDDVEGSRRAVLRLCAGVKKRQKSQEKILQRVCVWCLTYVFTRFVTSLHMFSIVFQNFHEQKKLPKLHQHRKKQRQRRYDKAPNRPLWLRYIHYTLVE